VIDEDVGKVAAEWVAAARAAWPSITLDEAVFVAQVWSKLPADASVDLARAVHASDLWLTLACASADPRALAAFDTHYVAPLSHVLRSLRLTPDQIDEVKQALRERLLVAGGERPRIAEFSGRAELRTWIRTTAVRLAIDLLRSQREIPLDDDEELVAIEAATDDPELTHLKDRYRHELHAAISDAIARLASRDRLVLKLHYIDRLGVERLGATFGVHHATAARWLIAARESLAELTRQILVAKLGVSNSELRSIARLVESQLDISMRRFLVE
jgi:RNA polymerase sigma-70 factor, ECF subfamily